VFLETVFLETVLFKGALPGGVLLERVHCYLSSLPSVLPDDDPRAAEVTLEGSNR